MLSLWLNLKRSVFTQQLPFAESMVCQFKDKTDVPFSNLLPQGMSPLDSDPC